jgi:ABC-type glycerol-3-phosphate transport system substrate-binding protein
LVLAGQGCGHRASPAIRLSSWGDPKENEILQAMINDFQKIHPDIKVELLRVPFGEYMTKLLSQVAGGVAPDVIFVSTDNVLNLSTRGVLEPLDDYLKNDPGFPIKDFYPSLIVDYTIDGKLYGVPRDMDPECDIYYNKKAFEEAGLPPPSDEWNWDDFLAAAKALTKKDAKGNVTRWGFADDWPNFDPWVFSSGARYVDNPYKPSKYTVDDPKFLRALQFRADLIWKHKVMPGPSNLSALGGRGTSDMFAKGTAAMFLSGLWHTPEFREVKDLSWDIAMFPKGPDGQRGFSIGGSGYGILQSSKNKKAAWELVKYISGPEGEKKMTETGLVYPALQSVANSPVFLDNQMPQNKKMLLGAEPYGVLMPRALNWREIAEGTITPALDKAWTGTSTPKEAQAQLVENLKKVPLVLK